MGAARQVLVTNRFSSLMLDRGFSDLHKQRYYRSRRASWLGPAIKCCRLVCWTWRGGKCTCEVVPES